jgi:hypothetical protein
MPAPARTRQSAALFASSCLAVAGLIAGCDTETGQADKAVEKSLIENSSKRGGEAVAGLQKASQEANASPGATAHAKTLLAQAKIEQARSSMTEAEQSSVAINRLVSEINDIAVQIRTNNTIIAGYQELSPKGTTAIAKLLEGERAKVYGKSPEDVWKLGQAGELPALSKTSGQAAKLSPQIKELEAKKADLAKQREAAEVKASDALRLSKRKTGKESLALFTQSVEDSKRSADLAAQIAQLDHQLLRLQQELALAQAQSQQLNATVKGIGERLGQNEKSQKTLQELIKGHQASSQGLVNGGSAENASAPTTSGSGEPLTIVTNSTMSAKAKELAAVLADTDAKRKTAIDLLTAALGHYDAALMDLQKARTELEKNIRDSSISQLPQAAAWKAAVAAYSPASLNIQKANVQQMLASLHRDALASIVSRRQMIAAVGPVLKEASIEAPAELADANLDTQLQETQKAATEAYDAADALLQEIIDGGNVDDATRNTAQTAQVIALYGRAQLALVAGDAEASKQALSRARETVNSGPMPADQYPDYVRVSLGMAKAATTAPAPVPTTIPASAEGEAAAQPAEGAPATAPADAAPPDAAPATAPTEGAPATAPAAE